MDFVPDYYVYTDGSCIHNGKPFAKAGMGIYFGEGDSRNLSKLVEGKQSNNTAELGAIYCLYDIIRNDILTGKKIVVFTDSVYAIRCLSTYGEKCYKKDWTQEIPNRELVKATYELYRGVTNVRFQHIMAHTNLLDRHSIGNENADRLANEAVSKGQPDKERQEKERPDKERPEKDQKIYLNVPYERKDEAKGLGAKWDYKKKRWYCFQNDSSLISMFL
jgi:ribonuclease HI